MSLESIEKMRELCNYRHRVKNTAIIPGGSEVAELGEPIVEKINNLADEIEREIAEKYMELPVDADGVPIHVGDVVAAQDEQPFEVRAFQLDALGWFAIERLGSQWNVNQLHHAKPRTVEDVLDDFARAQGYLHVDHQYKGITDYNELRAQYADELRELLGGDDE